MKSSNAAWQAWHGIYFDSVTTPVLVQGTSISASRWYEAIEVRPVSWSGSDKGAL